MIYIYYGDYDSGTDRSTYRLQDWADCAFEDSGSAFEQHCLHDRKSFGSWNRFSGVATSRTCTAANEQLATSVQKGGNMSRAITAAGVLPSNSSFKRFDKKRPREGWLASGGKE